MTPGSRVAACIVFVFLAGYGYPARAQAPHDINEARQRMSMMMNSRAMERPDYGSQVVEITPGSIRIQAHNSPRIRRIDVESDVSVSRLKAIKLENIKGPRWGYARSARFTVTGMDEASSGSVDIDVIYLAPMIPEQKTSVIAPLRRVVNGRSISTWSTITGMIEPSGRSLKLTAEGTTYELKPTAHCRIYEQTPIKLSEVKVGDFIDYDYRMRDRAQHISSMYVRPADEERPEPVRIGGGPPRVAGERMSRPNVFVPERNEVTSISAEAITVLNGAFPEGNTYSIAKDATAYRLKRINLADVKGLKWVKVQRMRPRSDVAFDFSTTTVQVTRMIVAPSIPKTIEDRMRGTMVVQARVNRSSIATWGAQPGLLDASATPPTFTVNDQRYALQFIDGAMIYERVPISFNDVKAGDIVDLEFLSKGGEYVIKGIDVRPIGEPRPPRPERVLIRPGSPVRERPIKTELSSGTLMETY